MKCPKCGGEMKKGYVRGTGGQMYPSARFEPTSDDFTVRVAERTEEVKALLEVGFEWVGQKEGLIFLRKRK
jgi:hypothetical protein